jgi:MFS-type transporter involved in bile tolerance (Atg22 family)
VLSVYVMSFFAGTPIGALIGGILASLIGLRATIVASAVLLAIAVVLMMLRYPWLRVLDETKTGFDAHVEGRAEGHGTDLDTAAHLIVEPLE